MPVVNQAPDKISVLELSEAEKRARLEDLETAVEIHDGIRVKVQKLLPAFDEIIREYLKFQKFCSSSAPLRAIRITNHLRVPMIFKVMIAVRSKIGQVYKDLERLEHRAQGMEKDILDPNLPGVVRDSVEVRKMLKRAAEEMHSEMVEKPPFTSPARTGW